MKRFLIALVALSSLLVASESFAACRGGRIRAAIFHPFRAVKHSLTAERSGKVGRVGCAQCSGNTGEVQCAGGQCRPTAK